MELVFHKKKINKIYLCFVSYVIFVGKDFFVSICEMSDRGKLELQTLPVSESLSL